ncbi:MAG: hypothetical protein JRC99_11325 [Deltaproteobacteria bacterium]|nr:hypothetical protein [Deltaproteobacteria bacterium]
MTEQGVLGPSLCEHRVSACPPIRYPVVELDEDKALVTHRHEGAHLHVQPYRRATHLGQSILRGLDTSTEIVPGCGCCIATCGRRVRQ